MWPRLGKTNQLIKYSLTQAWLSVVCASTVAESQSKPLIVLTPSGVGIRWVPQGLPWKARPAPSDLGPAASVFLVYAW